MAELEEGVVSGRARERGHCPECHGYIELRGQESMAQEACDCEYPACAECSEECPPSDRIPWGQGVVHFSCGVRQALIERKGRTGGAKVVVFSARRGPAFQKPAKREGRTA